MAAPTAPTRWITVGVDTHKDRHVAAAVDQSGRVLASTQAPTTVKGCKQLLAWAQSHGHIDRFGIEGTGAYGAGLARFLRAAGQQVVEVDRPNRQTRRRQGKSDPIDAEAAARAALAGTASGSPKARDGAVEAIRALRVARRSALKARTQAANQLDALVISARNRCAVSCARWLPLPGSPGSPPCGAGRRQPTRSRRPSWPCGSSPGATRP